MADSQFSPAGGSELLSRSPRKRMPSLGRIGRVLAIMLALVASLLTFPAGIPGMIGFWLGLHTLLVLQNRPGWWPLATCVALVAIKGTWPTEGLLVLLTALAGSVAIGVLRQFRPDRTRRPLIIGSLATLWAAWGLMLVDWTWGLQGTAVRAGANESSVVCLGDSLTANDQRTGGYPEVLQTLLARPVVNLGQPGITTAEALPKLRELERIRPGVVVIELGGHDFLKERPRAEAKANLERMIAGAKNLGAAVVLIEVPRGFIVDPWWGLERQIAREQRVRLVPDSVIRSFVLYSPFAPPGMWTGGPHLSEDGLHPNANGDRAFAAAVAGAIDSLTEP